MTDLTERLREERRDLTDHEQMLDAQSQCVPCKLCGGQAIISDAGLGAGYYIGCQNSLSMHQSKGCMLDERRLGGWAYNVMDWWNRLHTATTLETLTQENARLREAIKPFVTAAEPIIHDDKERWNPDKWFARLNRLTVGQFRALHAASQSAPARKALGGGDEA